MYARSVIIINLFFEECKKSFNFWVLIKMFVYNLVYSEEQVYCSMCGWQAISPINQKNESGQIMNPPCYNALLLNSSSYYQHQVYYSSEGANNTEISSQSITENSHKTNSNQPKIQIRIQ